MLVFADLSQLTDVFLGKLFAVDKYILLNDLKQKNTCCAVPFLVEGLLPFYLITYTLDNLIYLRSTVAQTFEV